MTSPLRKFLLKSSSGDVIVRREMRRAKSDSSTKMQIVIRSFESIDKNLYWDLPPDTRKIGLPSSRSLFTVLKSPHVHKKAREQFQMKINKEMLVMETKRHELRKKFFWLKRQRIFGAQFEVLFSFKTRLDQGKLQNILQPGLKDDSNDEKAKQRLVMAALNSLAQEGFYSDAVDASMNTIESSLSENNTGSFSNGLALMLRSVPMAALKDRVEKEKEEPKASFAPLIEKFILDNPHRPNVKTQPDQDYLENLKGNMSEEDLAELARVTCELRLNQETIDPPEAMKAVPSFSLKTIPRKPKHVQMEVGDVNGVKMLHHDLSTNDVLYADMAFDMSSLKPELLPLVPLFCRSLLEMGTKDLNFIQRDQLIGGISVYPFTSSKQGSKDPVSHIIVRGRAMSANTEDLFNLMKCILQDVQFTNQKRFKRFVSQSKSRLENRLRDSGHAISAARMNAKLNHAGWIAEQMGGLSYLEFLKDVEEKVEQDWSEVSASLEEIRKALLSKKNCLVNLTCDRKNLKNSETHVNKFLHFLPTTSPVVKSPIENALLPKTNEAIVIPKQVNYVGKAANIYETGYKLKGSAYIISKYIRNTWLWDNIRVNGEAFGGVCDFDTHSGVFSFLSYRDPSLLKTLDVFDGTSDFLRQLEMDDDTLKKAIFSTISDLDSYQLPDAKGYSGLLRYLLGVSEEERQTRREEIFSTRPSDLKEFAGAIDAIKNKGVIVVVASQDDIDAANKERSNFFQVKKVL